MLVKRIDVGLMMVFTYTAIVPDPEAKLLLFPVLSGIQVIATAWLKPFINTQAEVLDLLDVSLGTVRFIIFSSIAALLILSPREAATLTMAVLLLFLLLGAFAYLLVHIIAQFLRHSAAERHTTAKGTGLTSKFSSAATVGTCLCVREIVRV